jgi:seryl-tRNA synthetase
MGALVSKKTEVEIPLLEGLVEHGLLVPTNTLGVWGRGPVFERVVSALERLIDEETRADGATFLRFPPVLPRADFERSEFAKAFPHLSGVVHAFNGNPARHQEMLQRIEAGGDWSEFVKMTDCVLTPAACYPVYPSLAGVLPARGRLFDVSSYCFRHEPSPDPTRMVAFRMREQVRAGTPSDVMAFRESWILRARELFERLAVPAYPAPASDPFFGRGGRLLALTQAEQKLKFELLVSIHPEKQPTAVMSFNYHQDHFGRAFGFSTPDGARAHTACVGFGLERIALALFHSHGFVLDGWPSAVLSSLSP